MQKMKQWIAKQASEMKTLESEMIFIMGTELQFQ